MTPYISKSIREFQLFVKPVGALCNLGCSYCYYLEKQSLFTVNEPQMSDALLERYIIQHLETTTEEPILFSWHGGEPTLAGIEFYGKVVEMQRKHNQHNRKIINGIQTNGTNLNDAWCQFLSNENFMVGISLDGPKHLHDKYRQTKTGEPSFQKAINGYQKLKEYGIDSEILCVVNALNVDHPLEVYRFFKSLDAKYISFLPLVDRNLNLQTGVSPDSVPAKAFGDFMVAVFDEWQEQDIGNIRIQLVEEALRTAFSQEHTLCIFKKTCGGVPVLERNGNFYACDHFVNQEHLIGNINYLHLSELLDHPKQTAFGEAKYNTLPNCCLNCEVLTMCHGECPKNRFIQSPDGENGLNYLCEGYRKFFNHCTPFVKTIADLFASPS